jgi:hypothetical protein
MVGRASSVVEGPDRVGAAVAVEVLEAAVRGKVGVIAVVLGHLSNKIYILCLLILVHLGDLSLNYALVYQEAKTNILFAFIHC